MKIASAGIWLTIHSSALLLPALRGQRADSVLKQRKAVEMPEKCPKCGASFWREARLGARRQNIIAVPKCVDCGHNELHELREKLAMLDDDSFADSVARDCHDKDHDDRWCTTCAARSDGIEAYREALKAAAAKAKEVTSNDNA